MIPDSDIHHAANELVERYGDNAMSVARDRIAEFSAKPDQSGLNVALRVLSALEILLGSKATGQTAFTRASSDNIGSFDGGI